MDSMVDKITEDHDIKDSKTAMVLAQQKLLDNNRLKKINEKDTESP